LSTGYKVPANQPGTHTKLNGNKPFRKRKNTLLRFQNYCRKRSRARMRLRPLQANTASICRRRRWKLSTALIRMAFRYVDTCRSLQTTQGRAREVGGAKGGRHEPQQMFRQRGVLS